MRATTSLKKALKVTGHQRLLDQNFYTFSDRIKNGVSVKMFGTYKHQVPDDSQLAQINEEMAKDGYKITKAYHANRTGARFFGVRFWIKKSISQL